jgi:hypothetical protein
MLRGDYHTSGAAIGSQEMCTEASIGSKRTSTGGKHLEADNGQQIVSTNACKQLVGASLTTPAQAYANL